MQTREYEYFEFPFNNFNKAQAAAIPHIPTETNLVISFPTATGKTALAEAAFGFHFKTSPNSKCVYVSPYRSLSMQQYNAWKENAQFSKHGIVLSIGDRFACKEDFDSNRLIILTTESFDSKTRNQSQHKWLKEITCIVFDEAHLLGTKGRGDNVEVSLVRFTKLNPKARIILLSATMENAGELSSWLKSLNKKTTLKIVSTWRPSKIVTRFYTFDDEKTWEKKIELAKQLATTPRGEKIVVFVHSKKLGKEITKAVRKKGFICEFHNANLSHSRRKAIEEAFDNVRSGLDILVSTSTLSSGVNLG